MISDDETFMGIVFCIMFALTAVVVYLMWCYTTMGR